MGIRRVAYVQCHYCRINGPLVSGPTGTGIGSRVAVQAAEMQGWRRLENSTCDVCPNCLDQLSRCACGCGAFVAGMWVRGHNAATSNAEAAGRRNDGEGRQTLRPV